MYNSYIQTDENGNKEVDSMIYRHKLNNNCSHLIMKQQQTVWNDEVFIHTTSTTYSWIIDYIISEFDCYWLTSHCKEENSTYLLQYISSYYYDDTIEKLKKIKPTSWLTAKTEAIDFDSDFYWLDDYVFEFEKKVLKEYHKFKRWIKVNLSQENELKRIKELLLEKQSLNRKLFSWYRRSTKHWSI